MRDSGAGSGAGRWGRAAKSSPPVESTNSNGEANAGAGPALGWTPLRLSTTRESICPGPSTSRKIASGLRKMSRGPMKPAMERRAAETANSVLIAALEPLLQGSGMAAAAAAAALVHPLSSSNFCLSVLVVIMICGRFAVRWWSSCGHLVVKLRSTDQMTTDGGSGMVSWLACR